MQNPINFLVEIPFGIGNENTVKRFLENLQSFARHKFDITVKYSLKKSDICSVRKIKILILIVKYIKVIVPVQQMTLVKKINK